MPLAAFATLDAGTLTMDAAWGDPAGVIELVSVRASAAVTDLADAAALGTQLATDLRSLVLARGGSLMLPPDNE
jgi:hydroxymethylbilane synthase